MAAIQHFILMDDRARGQLIGVQGFGSDSLETVKLTHANYFNDQVGDSRYADSIAKYLTGV